MPTATDTVSMESRSKLISNFPLFSQLLHDDIIELASLSKQQHFVADEAIVMEGDIVDCFYLIVSGNAKVVHKKILDGKTSEIIISNLSSGESIGLSYQGYYSPHGRRTATVIALTDTVLLRIDIKDFQQFIKNHSGFDKSIEELTDLILKIDFIKLISPFSHLSHEDSYKLAQHVKEIYCPANSVIFNQGDISESCYLVRSGEVEIFTTINDSEHSLAIIKPPELIGEAALLTSDRRNASARASSNCTLLVIQNSLMLEILKRSEDFAESLMLFSIKRFRPTRRSNVDTYNHTYEDGQSCIMLHNTDLHQYYRLPEEGKFIWDQLDGVLTIQELTILFFQKYKVFTPEYICNLLYDLSELGFVSIQPFDTITRLQDKRPLLSTILNKAKKIIELNIYLTHTDVWLTKIYRKGIYLLFTIPFQCFFFLLIISGFFIFIQSYKHIVENAHHLNIHFLIFLLFMFPISLISVSLHEAGHAFTAKKLGYKIQRIGIGWEMLVPFAYVDTSELWAAKRGVRFFVNIAGIYMDLLVASCIALLSHLFVAGELAIYLWLSSLLIYFNAFRNLSPIKEYDGYFILSDLLNRQRLRKSAMRWLVHLFPNIFTKKNSIKNHKSEVTYWLACIAYLMIATYLIYLVIKILFSIFSSGFIFDISTYISAAIALTICTITTLNMLKGFFYGPGK